MNVMTRATLVLLACAALHGRAAAQTNINWANAGTDWFTGTNWVGGSVPSGTGNNAVFPNTTTIAAQPDVGAGTVTVNRISLDNTGGDWSLAGAGGTVTLSSAATAVGTAPFQLSGGGTSTFGPNFALPGQRFFFVTGSSTAVFNGQFFGSGNLATRVEAGSTLRLSAANANTGGVNLASSSGTNATFPVFQIGDNAALGTGTVTTSGGGGGSIGVEAFGADRVIGNRFLMNPTGANVLYFVGSNTLEITNELAPSSNGDHTYENRVTAAGKALRVSGPFSIRNDSDAATTEVSAVFRGDGRFDLTGVVRDKATALANRPGRLQLGTGNGATTLRLANGNNSYTGSTVVNSGTLLIAANATGAAGNTALGTATSNITVGATGVVSQAVLTDAAVTVGRNFDVSSVNPAPATFGGNSADVSGFTGTITVGTSANANAKTLLFAAADGGTVTFAGPVNRAAGYAANINLTKTGNGTVVLQNSTSADLGALVAVNAGTLRVDGTVAADRGVQVNAGTLRVNGGTLAVGAGSGILAVAPGATLESGATGTVTHAATVNGTVSPNGVGATGTFTFGNGLTVGGAYVVDVAGTAADRLAVTGPLTLNDAVLDLTGATPDGTSTYYLASYTGTVAGAFAGYGPGAGAGVFGGTQYYVQYDADLDLNGFLIPGSNILLTPVPEPGAILGLAAVALLAWRRRVM